MTLSKEGGGVLERWWSHGWIDSQNIVRAGVVGGKSWKEKQQ